MSLSKFGPFVTALTQGPRSIPGYLELLNFSDDAAAQGVIDRIQSVLSTGEAGSWIDALLMTRTGDLISWVQWRSFSMMASTSLRKDFGGHLTREAGSLLNW